MAKRQVEAWDRWYRHDIDDWQGSADVAALTPQGYKAFHSLLMYQFQRPNGMIADDPRVLRVQSRLSPKDWAGCSADVLALFTRVGDHIYNPKMFDEWKRSQEHKEMREERASLGGKARKEQREAVLKSAQSTPEAPPKHAEAVLKSATVRNGTERNKEQQQKIFAPSPSGVVASPATERGPLVVSIPLIASHGDWPVFDADATQLQTTYPAVNVRQELREMAQWCKDNPSQRKTKTGVRAFISRWLAKEQDRGNGAGRQHSIGGAKSDRNLAALERAWESDARIPRLDKNAAHGDGERAPGDVIASGSARVLEGNGGLSPAGHRESGATAFPGRAP